MDQKITTKENQGGNSIENLVDVPPATTLPHEILEIIFADCFEPFLLEDQFIREQIILKFYKEFYIQEPVESVFVRQKRIYQSASSLLTICRTFYAALRNSNVFWQKIFHLTLGASSWLLNTPSVIQARFNGSYYQACKYLMTFGEKLDPLKLSQLHPELTFVGIGTTFILFQNDANEYLRYDLSTRTLVPLSSITKAGVNSVHDKYLIIEDGFLVNLSIYIYDLLEDRLLQEYENVTEEFQGMITTYKFVHYGDWLAYRFLVRSTREGEPYHMMFGISEDVVKKQKQFDYLRIKDDHTHRLWFKQFRAHWTDILFRCVIKANSALNEFSHTSNDNWRIFYSIQWCVDDRELVIYDEEDWKEMFQYRFNAEKLLEEKKRQNVIMSDSQQDDSKNEVKYGFDSRLLVESTETLMRIEFSAQVAVREVESTITAVTKILRHTEGLSQKDTDKLMELLADYLGALDNVIRKFEPECIGLVSFLNELIDTRFHAKIIVASMTLFNKHLAIGEADEGAADYRSMADNLGTVRRVVEIFEKVVWDKKSTDVLLATLQVLLKKGCQDAKQLVHRPAFIKRLKTLVNDELSNPCLAAGAEFKSDSKLSPVTAVIGNVVHIDPDYAGSQGLLELIIDIAYRFDGIDKWLLYEINLALFRFSSKNLSKKIASNSSLLSRIILLFHRHAKHFDLSGLRMVVLFISELCRRQQNMAYMFDAGYLDEFLPYLKQITTKNLFMDMCDMMGYYLRHGIEHLRLNEVHKKLEPHLQTIINNPQFKESIPFWQNYYCGMPMPREITKSLVERIVPELPLETDLEYARAYTELLANIVQSDRAVLLEMDIQFVFEHLALKLILDEDRENDTHSRGQIPYPICFLSASVSLPQAAQLAIKNDALLDKMYSLYDATERNETIYMVTHFFGHLVKLEGWDNVKGLEILTRFGSTMPLDADMYFLFTFIEPYSHLFLHDNPVEMVLYGSWLIARMSQRKEGRLGLKKLNSEVIEWLSGHSDMRIRKNMNHYHQNMENAKKMYDI